MEIRRKSPGREQSPPFGMKTVRLTSRDAGNPLQCSTMLKMRALIDDGTALHRHWCRPIRGPSWEAGWWLPPPRRRSGTSSSGFGGMRGAASTGTEACAKNGLQCSAICLGGHLGPRPPRGHRPRSPWPCATSASGKGAVPASTPLAVVLFYPDWRQCI